MTVILPRRSYSPLLGRFLHDRTADKIARVISRIPRSAATIIPYDVQSRLEVLQERETARAGRGPGQPPDGGRRPAAGGADGRHDRRRQRTSGRRPEAGRRRPAGTVSPAPARSAPGSRARRQAAVAGDATARKPDDYERPVPSGRLPTPSAASPGPDGPPSRAGCAAWRSGRSAASSVFAVTVADSTGELTALFYGRQHIAGIEPGAKIRLTGAFGIRAGMPGMINPTYELLSQTHDAGCPAAAVPLLPAGRDAAAADAPCAAVPDSPRYRARPAPSSS